MSEEKEKLNDVILSTQSIFQDLDSANGNLLDFKQQCMFARQQVTKNDFTKGVAATNPTSLKSAICNVAAIGISLNPALAHAYLVPRDGGICLDISYRGLVKLATDSGAILWAKTELVYKNDTFTWNGVNNEPKHEAEIFSDRGYVIGGYCLAKLPDGSVMVETMNREEMDKIQATSKAANGPWKTWTDEMRKKSITKRASKSWPQTENRERIDKAISVLNEYEGLAQEEEQVISYTPEQSGEYKRCLTESDWFNLAGLTMSLDVGSQTQLWSLHRPESKKGEKTKDRKKFSDNLKEGTMQLEANIHTIAELIEGGDDSGALEIAEDCSDWTYVHILAKLSDEHEVALNEICSRS